MRAHSSGYKKRELSVRGVPLNDMHHLFAAIEVVLAVLLPLQIHLFVVLFDEALDAVDLSVIQSASLLQFAVAVFLDEELRRPRFRQLLIARMDMHALDDAEGGEVQKVPGHLELIVFRHGRPPCISDREGDSL